MAAKKCQWSMENLEKALQDVIDNQLSVRTAARKPKSILHGCNGFIIIIVVPVQKLPPKVYHINSVLVYNLM